MNLDKIIKETTDFCKLRENTLFHNTISLIVSQKISFQEGKKIRENLFKKLGKYDIDYDSIKKFTEKDFIDMGMDQTKISTITKILGLPINFTIEDLKNVKGIGPWTIKSLKIYNGETNIFLAEDYWIRKRLSELYDKKTVVTISEANKLILNIDCDKTELSKFLWRIKPIGITKLKNDKTLDRNDFL